MNLTTFSFSPLAKWLPAKHLNVCDYCFVFWPANGCFIFTEKDVKMLNLLRGQNTQRLEINKSWQTNFFTYPITYCSVIESNWKIWFWFQTSFTGPKTSTKGSNAKHNHYLCKIKLNWKPAVVAEWSKELSQIQVERMPKVPGLNPRSGLPYWLLRLRNGLSLFK